jgi:hypothetical protein
VCSDASQSVVVLAAEASELRRRLGPTAWVVLEEMLLASRLAADGRVAQVSVRSLARSVGIAKNTAARAIGRLHEAGVVAPVQSRTPSGVFDTGCYVIAVPEHISMLASVRTAPPPRTRVAQGVCAQLSLAIEP